MENTENRQDRGEPRDGEQAKPTSTELLSIKSDMVEYLLNDENTNKYVQAVNKLRVLAIKMTKPWDWVKFGNTAHLQDKRLAELNTYLQTLYGVNITLLKPVMTKETFKGYQTVKNDQGVDTQVEVDVIEYIQTGGVKIEEVREREGQMRRVRTIEPITGSCRTDDKLFAKRHGVFLDPLHIQPSMVIKKADANYRGNCYRYIWGLKAMSLDDLAAAGLDITKLMDSNVQGVGQAVPQSKEALNSLDELWKRIVRVNNGMADKAREWMRGITAYPAGTNKQGKAYKAFDGHTDIHRIDVATIPGRIAKEKIEKELVELEQSMGDGQAQDMENREGERLTGAAAFNDYKAKLEAAKTMDEVINLDKKISVDKTLNSAQISTLNRIVSSKADTMGGA